MKIRWDSAVEEILGDGSPRAVTGVRIRNVLTGALDDLDG